MTELFLDRVQRFLSGNRFFNEFSDALNHKLNTKVKERRLSRKRLRITKRKVMTSFNEVHTDILSALRLSRNASHKRIVYDFEQPEVKTNMGNLRQAMADALNTRNRIEALFDELDLLLATEYKAEEIGESVKREMERENESQLSMCMSGRPVSAIMDGHANRSMSTIHEEAREGYYELGQQG